MLGNVVSIFGVGYGVACLNTATIFLGFVLFSLSMRLAKELA